MKIYLADLTHTTITISNDSFPLNVAMVAAYAKKIMPDLEISLFKYPEELKVALDREMPQILGLSNYPWNLELDRSFLRHVKKESPGIITVMGGPNISYEPADQLEFLTRLKGELDFYVMHEGETGFAEVLRNAVAHAFNVEKMKAAGFPGVIFLRRDQVNEYEPIPRMTNLDDYPSPYLTGMLDKFFDDKLSPMIETHRGCPFKCTYCHEGHSSYTKVNKFSTERVCEQLEYISQRIGKTVKNMLIADPNFGMLERDIEVAEKINEIHDKTGFPQTLFATTAKNRGRKLIEISKRLQSVSMPLWMSVQSMDSEVLKNIKRKNISVEDMINTQYELADYGCETKSELIIPLPGESFATHVKALAKLIELRIGQIVCYQLMLVQGSEMEMDKATQKAAQFQSKFRVLPRSFSNIPDLEKSIETEEIVIATKDFSFEEYLKARTLHLAVSVFYNGRAFAGFFKFLLEQKVDIQAFLFRLADLVAAHRDLSALFAAFLNDTQRELFATEAELRAYYADDANFEKLLNGSDGANLLQKYTSALYLKHSLGLVDAITSAVLTQFPDHPAMESQIRDIANHHRMSFSHFLDADRREVRSKALFGHDVAAWLKSDRPLAEFKFDQDVEIVFHTPDEQYELMESYFKRYGRDNQAFGKVMTRLWIGDMLRVPAENHV
ncbi:MAG: radical SAM protein [Sulfuricella sp.]|nr:radical SAM protein [Sulfuricella sp.]